MIERAEQGETFIYNNNNKKMLDEKTKLTRSRAAVKGHFTREIDGLLNSYVTEESLIWLSALENSYSDKLN